MFLAGLKFKIPPASMIASDLYPFASGIISISYSGIFFDCEKKSDSGFMQKKTELLLYSSAKDCFFTLLWRSPVPFQKQR